MTPFKFGKKKKDQKSDSTFTSPSSQRTGGNPNIGSPQISNYSTNSYGTARSGNTVNNSPGYQVDNLAPPSQGHHPPPLQNQQQHPAQRGYNQSLAYDQNNNIYNPRSPQRHQRYPSTDLGQNPKQGGSNTQLVPSPWSRSKLMISPFPRYRHAASNLANDKGEVFVMGGLHNTSVYGDTWIIKQDIDGNSFQTFQVDIYENSPAPRVGHASTLCGNAYVIFGGDTVTNDSGEIDNDLYLFNMNSHTWTIPHPIGKLPSGRYGHTIGVVAVTNFDSKLYLYGGQLDDVIYNDLVMFNLSSFRRPDVQWEWIIPEDRVQPPGLTNHTMDVYDNKLWLYGGSTGKSLSNELWVFDPMTNKWENIQTAGVTPPAVEEHASVVFKDLLIIHGGKNQEGEAVSDVYVLNLVSKTWFKLPSSLSLEPQGKYGHSLSILKNNKLLLLGGHLPDFAKVGDDLEPSLEDNGVGTILHTLDLTNLTKLIPGLYQYYTPGNVAQDRFVSNENTNSNIFTPPSANQQQQQQQQQQTPTQQNTVPKFSSSASLNSNTSRQLSTGSRQLSNSKESPDAQRPHPQVQTPQKYPQQTTQPSTPPVASQQSTPVNANHSHAKSEDTYEEDLPLQIPSPIKTQGRELPIPAPIAKDGLKQQVRDNDSLENFETPAATPFEQPAGPAIASQDSSFTRNNSSAGYFQGDAKGSDFFDTYANDNSTSSLQDKLDEVEQREAQLEIPPISGATERSISVADSQASNPVSQTGERTSSGPLEFERQGSVTTLSSSDRKDSVISNNAIFGVGAAAAVGTGLKNVFVGRNQHAIPEESSPSTTRALPGSFIENNSSTTIQDNGEKQQFKNIIDSLSSELEDLKVSTNNQIKSASLKVQELEEENSELKQKLEQQSKEITPVEDESDIKRKHIKLNTEHQILAKEHGDLKSKFEELQPVFSSNLIDLARLNEVIKKQQSELEENAKKLKEQEDWKLKFEQLQLEHNALLEKTKESESTTSRSLDDDDDADITPSSTSKLTKSIDLFLSQYSQKDEETGEIKPRELSAKSSSDDSTVTESLRSQIDELLKENEEAQSKNKELSQKLEESSSQHTSELETLRNRVTELSKLEENYKESLHSVKNSSKALQISQSELAKQKEISIKLQEEIDELKIFKARRNFSRNATPIVDDANNKSSDGEGEEDIENAHYNLKLRDLQAELFIVKQERDEMKESILDLKKKLLVATTPSNSL